MALNICAIIPNAGSCWTPRAGRAGLTSSTSCISLLLYKRRGNESNWSSHFSALMVTLLLMHLLGHFAREIYGLRVSVALGDMRSTLRQLLLAILREHTTVLFGWRGMLCQHESQCRFKKECHTHTHTCFA